VDGQSPLPNYDGATKTVVPKKAAQAKVSEIRAELRDRWVPFLSDQDKRPKWGATTVLNKEDDEERVERASMKCSGTY
jgi:hypothetical protein